jgi:hypothetical protein
MNVKDYGGTCTADGWVEVLLYRTTAEFHGREAVC